MYKPLAYYAREYGECGNTRVPPAGLRRTGTRTRSPDCIWRAAKSCSDFATAWNILSRGLKAV
jgi:hypothetical protein